MVDVTDFMNSTLSLLFLLQDLELTVHIGKELLTQNGRLERRVAELETELKTANENFAQMNHELLQKNELINVLTENDDGSESCK